MCQSCVKNFQSGHQRLNISVADWSERFIKKSLAWFYYKDNAFEVIKWNILFMNLFPDTYSVTEEKYIQLESLRNR